MRTEPLAAGGMSGAQIERGWLDDGSVVIIKYADANADWIMRATGDTGRVAALWDEGVFDRVPRAIEHAMLDVRREPGGAVIVMKDMSAAMFTDGAQLRASHHRVLDAARAIHDVVPLPPRAPLCALRDVYAFLSPQVCAAFAADNDVPRDALEGWSRFADVVPRDVSDAVSAVHADPDRLADALLARRCALLHGDLKMANLGADGGRIVIVDWGTLTTWAPPAVEYAWYIAVNSAAIGATLDSLLDDVRQTDAGDDEPAVRLALLGALAQLGWAKALGATSDDARTRERELDGLAWWTAQVRKTLRLYSHDTCATIGWSPPS